MIIVVKNAAEAFQYKDQLTSAGLYVDVDYTWTYTPPRDYYEDPYNYAGELLGSVKFQFNDPALESFYSLKWLK